MGQATQQGTDGPTHHTGTRKGENIQDWDGNEAGRHHKDESGAGRPSGGRTARDSTSINPEHEEPISPEMPHMPPA